MAIFCPLYSGSSGNSAYVDAGESSLLIDLGVSCKAAVTALNTLGADFSKLKGILITHEHSDHIKGLRVFLKNILFLCTLRRRCWNICRRMSSCQLR